MSSGMFYPELLPGHFGNSTQQAGDYRLSKECKHLPQPTLPITPAARQPTPTISTVRTPNLLISAFRRPIVQTRLRNTNLRINMPNTAPQPDPGNGYPHNSAEPCPPSADPPTAHDSKRVTVS
ncbi:hypothetical protein KC19_1G103200 [Ceratodon purpureus]|uniref:Uncharacterized protein n=1 Tax=Ceratodon purpureus TaxID=3225 RepID=A0A8T0J5N5_CERPU|nr:hypothetical protein KC19_1G103200 [Ceratodon purpureus]